MELTEKVPEENYFHYRNGNVIKDVVELIRAIEKGSDEDFNHHVAHGRNDFSDWIKNIYKQEELAREIISIKDKEKLVGKLKEALEKELLENVLEEKKKEKFKAKFVEIKEEVPVKPVETRKQDIFATEKPVSKEIIMEKKPNYFLIGLLVGIIVGMILVRLFLS